MPTLEKVAVAENVPITPKNEVVEAFRADINREFMRFQNFYDRANVAMRSYRLDHVELITSIYNDLMTVFGDDLGAIHELLGDLSQSIEDRTAALGGVNACITRVTEDHVALQGRMNEVVQECAISANVTLQGMLSNIFYPTFQAIQTELSSLPLAVVDALSRGNVLGDEQAIISYLDSRYEAYELQWLGGVSQLLTWDTSRFRSEGLFIVDESTICLAQAIMDLIFDFSRLNNEIRDC